MKGEGGRVPPNVGTESYPEILAWNFQVLFLWNSRYHPTGERDHLWDAASTPLIHIGYLKDASILSLTLFDSSSSGAVCPRTLGYSVVPFEASSEHQPCQPRARSLRLLRPDRTV